MTPESAYAAVPPPPPPGMGEASRLAGVFFEPGKAFADIARRPFWVVPMVLSMLVGLAFAISLGQRIGWVRIVDQQVEASLAKANPEQRAAMERQLPLQRKITPVIAYVGAIAGPILGGLIVAGLLTGIIGGAFGTGIKFNQMMGVWFYSGMPSLLWTLLAIGTMFLKPADDFNLRNPLAFNPGAFLDPTSGSKFVYTMASAFDLFTLWRMLLLATGIKAAAGKKFSFLASFACLFVPWFLLALAGAALAALFS